MHMQNTTSGLIAPARLYRVRLNDKILTLTKIIIFNYPGYTIVLGLLVNVCMCMVLHLFPFPPFPRNPVKLLFWRQKLINTPVSLASQYQSGLSYNDPAKRPGKAIRQGYSLMR